MTEDKYQEQCSAVVRLVQSSQYKYRAEQCVCECVGYAVQYAIAIILEIYLYQTSKKQIKTSSSISAPAAAEELRVTEFTKQRREETRQEVYTAAAAASLTHALQAVHVHSSWPGLRVFAQL